MTASNVDHPAHYGGEDDPYEVIKVAEAWGFDGDAYLFNVLKYIRREKDDELEDLKKAQFYLNRKIARMEQTAYEHEAALAWKDAVEKQCPLLGPYRTERAYSRLLKINTGTGDRPFEMYSLHADLNWRLETLAGIVATALKRDAKTRYGIGLGFGSGFPLLDQAKTVEWLLGTYDPDQFDYYLKAALDVRRPRAGLPARTGRRAPGSVSRAVRN